MLSFGDAMEQRRRPRVDCTLSVQVHAPSEDVLLFTYATNLSTSGVFVRANRPLPVGTRVKMQLHQARGERLALDGEVVRVASCFDDGPRGMGLSFSGAGGESTRKLGVLLQRVGGKASIPAADAEAYAWHKSE